MAGHACAGSREVTGERVSWTGIRRKDGDDTMGWRIGVDIGGTFTDVAVLDETSGRVGIAKVSTTPRDFGAAVIEGTRAAMDAYRIAPETVSLLSHATTIVTNALLESKGANVALVATRGFRDVLELRRSARADLYDLFQDAPAVRVPRRRRLEITERIDAQGEIVTALDEAEIDTLIGSIRGLGGVEAVAVCLMFSFLNDVHEQRIGERLRAALPGLPVFLSSEILPENPRVRAHEHHCRMRLRRAGARLLPSNAWKRPSPGSVSLRSTSWGRTGGVLDVASAIKVPAAAVESGPAAGVIAAQRLGEQVGRANLISFDMGGTTAKASLIENGRIETTSEYEVGGQGNVGRWLHGTGHPIRLPVIDLAEVSAGGGSIAWIDPGGALRVGPASAGAEPGPACYGLGGDRPTVTDANVVLGYLSRTHLLGGRLPIDAAAAEAAVRAHVADPLGQSVMEAAARHHQRRQPRHGGSTSHRIRRARARRARVQPGGVRRGRAPSMPRALAEEIDIPEVIVPPIPGGFSALGLVTTDLRRGWSHTFYSPIESIDLDALNQRLAELERAAEFMLRGAGVPEPDRAIERAADCRYTKQAYELTVPLASGTVTRETLDALAREFHAQHLRTYGHENPNESVQMVNVRVTATGRMPRVEFHAHAQPPVVTKAKAGGGAATGDGTTAGGGAMSDDGVATEREVWFGEPVLCPVIGRHDLAAGPSDSGAGTPAGAGTDLGAGTGTEVGTEVYTRVGAKVDTGIGTARPGPLIVEEMDCTVVVPPGWSATLDERGFIVMTRIGRDRSD